jgi:uncharacterized protein (DUF488 family)
MSGETPSEPAPSTNPVFTIGHSTRSIAAFTALLAEAEIDLCVDVRSIPRSRTNPQFNTEILPVSLAAVGIGYRHLGALGGRRGRQDDGAPSPNGLWRNAAFRNYADYAMTPPFRAGLADLLALARTQRCAIMCAEAVWWRCHRRIIADYLLAAGVSVAHIIAPHDIEPAQPTAGVERAQGGALLYPPASGAGQGVLDL